MHTAGANFVRVNLCGEIASQLVDGNRYESGKHGDRLWIGTSIIENAKNAGNLYSQTFYLIHKVIDGCRLIMRNDLGEVKVSRVLRMQHELDLPASTMWVRPSAERDVGDALFDKASEFIRVLDAT